MNSITSPACSPPSQVYKLIGDLQVTAQVTDNPFQLPLAALFKMAARINKKRGFLFVSKLLGKHIPVDPLIPFVGGAMLAERYLKIIYGLEHYSAYCDLSKAITDNRALQESWAEIKDRPIALPEPALFIGFAETATALGHAMFRCFKGDSIYLHTTRDHIPEFDEVLDFREEHSHAPDHHCYADPKLFSDSRLVVLIDDELTTGKSALNFIREIQSKFPRPKYVVVSILDWRSDEDEQKLKLAELELGIVIQTVSLVSGRIRVEGKPSEHIQAAASPGPLLPGQPEVEIIRLNKEVGKLYHYSSRHGHSLNTTPYLSVTGRFGLTAEEEDNSGIAELGEQLRLKRGGARTLCLGTEEFMYVPFKTSLYMGPGVSVQSTTRSPIYPLDEPDYAVKQAIQFTCPYDSKVTNYTYNIEPGFYDEAFVFLERDVDETALEPIIKALSGVITQIKVVIYVPQSRASIIRPQPIGSYSDEDVVFLLKEISGLITEQGTEEREEAIQSGRHYSEMLPREYQPTPEYIKLFHQTLEESAAKVAKAVGITAELIVKCKGTNLVLASLARAGTPIGILIKRYIEQRYNTSLPHYSISIIRDRGLDENAIKYILQQHPGETIQFIDGWTGKGAIMLELEKACRDFNERYGTAIDPDLAVLADPGYCVRLYGTREDFLIPSACLNSTVSGLVSRTVYRPDIIGPNDFHGAKYYSEWARQDVSNLFIETIAKHFLVIAAEAVSVAEERALELHEPNWAGLKLIREIQAEFGLPNINLVKPGVGETTRVLLRRVPWKILVDSMDNPNLKHILLLAKDRGVTVEEYPGLTYSCCGLIRSLGGL